jgi:hypothetical protein
MNLVDTAVRYAERGVPVFPVRGKLPLTEHGFKDASKDANTIRAWFQRWPDANVAIPTGPASGFVVLDVDPRHDGDKSLAALEEKHGRLPLTLEARTGGGGRHFFFALGSGQNVRNSNGKLGPGLDVRGDGGYVVAPPSIHPETKQPYAWANRLEAAPTPPWLIHEVSAPAAMCESASGAPIPSGQRNDELTRIAGAMRRKGCTTEAIEAALLVENVQRCNPPLSEPEVRAIAQSVSRYAPAPGAAQARRQGAQSGAEQSAELPLVFPEAACRGVFADYRKAMTQATEASDVFHFATLWARAAVALGRRVSFPYGMPLFPNAYVVCFGPTGDKKTTATRKCAEIGDTFKIVCGGGSGEGMADEFATAEPGQGLLIHTEEFAQILRPGRWDGATLIPFLTQCFDCPEQYQLKFRKSPVNLERPTPSLLAGTTPEWFWKDFNAKDFPGGFGNRLFFLTGTRKPAIALPRMPNLSEISNAVNKLSAIQPCQAHLSLEAADLWGDFYAAWDAEEGRRDPLMATVIKRIPAYVLKLTMVYGAFEATLPEMTVDQLAAAIQVGHYGERCAGELLSLQNAGTNPKKELERRILGFVITQPGKSTTKRQIYRHLHRHYRNTEEFNRAFDSLVRAGELFSHPVGQSTWVGLDPE